MTYIPSSFVNGTTPALSAAEMNKIGAGIRDAHQMYEEGFGAADANVVDVGESTTNDQWTTLTSYGPFVDVEVGPSGKALVFVSAQIQSASGGAASMGFEIQWGVDQAEPPTVARALRAQLGSGAYGAFTKMSLVTGLPPQTTFHFVAMYKSDSGVSVLFNSRAIGVIPL